MSSRFPIRFACVVFVAVLAGACATSGTGDGTSSRGSRGDITAEDLTAETFQNCFQAVQRLRPIWLQRRGGQPLPSVFQDGVQLGDVTRLRDVPVQGVARIRFISSADATTRFGTGFSGGVIEILTR